MRQSALKGLSPEKREAMTYWSMSRPTCMAKMMTMMPAKVVSIEPTSPVMVIERKMPNI